MASSWSHSKEEVNAGLGRWVPVPSTEQYPPGDLWPSTGVLCVAQEPRLTSHPDSSQVSHAHKGLAWSTGTSKAGIDSTTSGPDGWQTRIWTRVNVTTSCTRCQRGTNSKRWAGVSASTGNKGPCLSSPSSKTQHFKAHVTDSVLGWHAVCRFTLVPSGANDFMFLSSDLFSVKQGPQHCLHLTDLCHS